MHQPLILEKGERWWCVADPTMPLGHQVQTLVGTSSLGYDYYRSRKTSIIRRVKAFGQIVVCFESRTDDPGPLGTSAAPRESRPLVYFQVVP